MQFPPGRHRASWARRGGPGARRTRVAVLTALAAAAVVLTLAVAEAGPVGEAGGVVARFSGSGSDPGSGSGGDRDATADHKAGEAGTRTGGERTQAGGAARAPRGDGGSGAYGDGEAARDDRAPTPSESPLPLRLGLATAARCGPELTSPEGIEAQTCVLTQGDETWGRTYYRNATGDELKAVLTLMAPEGRTIQMHCAMGAQDEPGVCETPRERTRGNLGGYTAVSEFAAGPGGGPLLLRSGSNSARAHGG